MLTNFGYLIYDRNFMWLEPSQFSKKITEGNARKLAVNFTDLVTLSSQKSEKKRDSGFARHTSAQLARGPKNLGSLLKARQNFVRFPFGILRFP